MTKLRKLGLTALAGSLVAGAASAGELAVSGTAKISYVSNDETEVTGNSWSTDKAIGFSGSGELDNGYTVNYSYTMTDAAFSTAVLSLDMGDMGVLSFNNSSSTGITAYDGVMPTAGEEVWDDMDGQANGVVGITNDGAFGYVNSFGPISISAAYNNDGSSESGPAETTESGSSKSIVITTSSLMDGLELGVGRGDKAAAKASNDETHTTAYAKYTVGAVTVGFQRSDIEKPAGTADVDRDEMAISFAVNENLSVSYGKSTVDFNTGSKVDQEDSGIAASYTMGSMTFGASLNSSDAVGGASGTDDSHTEMSVKFAF